MRKATLTLLLLLLTLGALPGCKPGNPDPQAEWKHKEIDFGPVKQGTAVVRTFHFTNVGTQPLLIRDVKTACGCTAVDWPRGPVQPGEKGEIRVRYTASANLVGLDLKHVTVLANTKPDYTNLYLKANIVL